MTSDMKPVGGDVHFTLVKIAEGTTSKNIPVYSPQDWAKVPFMDRVIARLSGRVTDIQDKHGVVIGIADNQPCGMEGQAAVTPLKSKQVLQYSDAIVKNMNPIGRDTGITYTEIDLGSTQKIRVYSKKDWEEKVPRYIQFFARGNITDLGDGRIAVNKIYTEEGDKVQRTPIKSEDLIAMTECSNDVKRNLEKNSLDDYKVARGFVEKFIEARQPLTDACKKFTDSQRKIIFDKESEWLETQISSCLKTKAPDIAMRYLGAFLTSNSVKGEVPDMYKSCALSQLQVIVGNAKNTCTSVVKDHLEKKNYKGASEAVEKFKKEYISSQDRIYRTLGNEGSNLKSRYNDMMVSLNDTIDSRRKGQDFVDSVTNCLSHNNIGEATRLLNGFMGDNIVERQVSDMSKPYVLSQFEAIFDKAKEHCTAGINDHLKEKDYEAAEKAVKDFEDKWIVSKDHIYRLLGDEGSKLESSCNGGIAKLKEAIGRARSSQ